MLKVIKSAQSSDVSMENLDDATTRNERISSNTWTREELFYFVNHGDILDLAFPCLTREGTDPGKPCISSCDSTDNSCHTRMGDGSVYTDRKKRQFWGYCDAKCKGEVANPSSPYNLALKESLWSKGFYDLRMYSSGLCYTYDPPEDTPTNQRKR